MIFTPFVGEMGWEILGHIRHVHAKRAMTKVVCCERDHIGLFPSAHWFFCDYTLNLEDKDKGIVDFQGGLAKEKILIARRAQASLPDAGEIYEVPVCQVANQRIKFKPNIDPPTLPVCDIVICARKREHVPERNWPHWAYIVEELQKAGITVGTVGAKETSAHTSTTVKSWRHPIGPLSGTLEMLNSCRLYVGTDTGPTHLAALMDVPILMFSKNINYRMTQYIKEATDSDLIELPDSVWEKPEVVLKEILSCWEQVQASPLKGNLGQRCVVLSVNDSSSV